MSKIVCDICGTSYAETAKQCPICGSVRPGDAQRVTNEVKKDGTVSTGYTHVKGGRFSKSNVKKRTKAQTGNGSKASAQNNRNDEDAKSNRGLVLLAIMLLLAIIGVVAYIAVRFFAPISDPNAGNPTDQLGSDINLSCRDMTLDTYAISFDQAGIAKLLNVKTTPEKPSEPVTFSSDNESVATVSDKGKITAVAEGTAKITVTCGKVSRECIVTVQFANQDTNPDATTPDASTPDGTTAPSEPSNTTDTLHLINSDITFRYKGQSAVLYTGNIPKNQIKWSSGNEAIATFVDGKAVAVANGTTTVYAEYQGQKVSCIIRCSFDNNTGIDGNGGVSEDGGGSSTTVITGYANVTDFLRVRSGPGTSYAEVGQLKPKEKITITEKAKDANGKVWGKIGTDKWVSMDYIKVD